MIDILGITLDIFRFYAPLVLGATYVVGYERKKLDNLCGSIPIDKQMRDNGCIQSRHGI